VVRSRDDVRRRLIVSCLKFGDLSGWRAACEEARDAGWTQREVGRILWLYHPSTWLYGGLVAFVVGIVAYGLIWPRP
jgi:hypothetical protein